MSLGRLSGGGAVGMRRGNCPEEIVPGAISWGVIVRGANLQEGIVRKLTSKNAIILTTPIILKRHWKARQVTLLLFYLW